MFTARQYRPEQKREFIDAFPVESKAAAELLADDLPSLTFAFASVFHEPGGVLAGVRIEFKTKDQLSVWIDVDVGSAPKKVLDGRR